MIPRQPSASPPIQTKQCFECGAVLYHGDKSCWMCHADQPLMGRLIAVTPGSEKLTNPWTVKGAIWLGIIAAVIVTYGVLRTGDEILAGVFLVAAVPTLAIVLLGSTIALASGRPWGAGTKIGVAAGTLLTTVAVMIVAAAVAVLVIFAMFIAMLQDCLKLLSGGA